MKGLNPHSPPSVSIHALGLSLFEHKALIVQMTRRDIAGRYAGSLAGLAWAFVTPALMLAVYTFVFSQILGSRWGSSVHDESKVQFALVLFAGLIVLNLFSDVLHKAPGLILNNANYVKKVVFPLEILAAVTVGTALFNAFVSLLVLAFALLISGGNVHWTTLLIPVVLLPLAVLALGIAWFLASLGVYLRDIGQTIGMVTTALMFLSPVFYPADSVPLGFRPYLMANPLTFIIEQSRRVMIWGQTPDWQGLAVYLGVSILIAWGGFAWFQKTRKGFADVL